MTRRETPAYTVAACPDCNAPQLGRRWADGTAHAIGPPASRCSCGSAPTGDVTIVTAEVDVSVVER